MDGTTETNHENTEGTLSSHVQDGETSGCSASEKEENINTCPTVIVTEPSFCELEDDSATGLTQPDISSPATGDANGSPEDNTKPISNKEDETYLESDEDDKQIVADKSEDLDAPVSNAFDKSNSTPLEEGEPLMEELAASARGQFGAVKGNSDEYVIVGEEWSAKNESLGEGDIGNLDKTKANKNPMDEDKSDSVDVTSDDRTLTQENTANSNSFNTELVKNSEEESESLDILSTEGNDEANDHEAIDNKVIEEKSMESKDKDLIGGEPPLTDKETQPNKTIDMDEGKQESNIDHPPKNPDSSQNTKQDAVDDTSDIKASLPEWIDILGNNLLQKKVLVPGKGKDTRPVNGQEVTLNVKGKLADGSAVDCHDELVFQLGDEDVIVALELATALMENGEHAIVKTNSKYAFGKYGRPDFDPPVPPDADIEYELRMLSVKEGKEIGSLTDDERIAIGDKKRMKGNYLYGLGDYEGAVTMYTRGVKYLERSSRKDVADLCVKCWNNLSAAQLKVQAYKQALQSCEMVLRAEPENMKGYFRKGKCFEGLGDAEEALKCMKKASMLDPQNKMILQELGRLKAKVVKSQMKEREMYQRMMQGSIKNIGDDIGESSGSWYPYIIGAVAVATGGVMIVALLNRLQKY